MRTFIKKTLYRILEGSWVFNPKDYTQASDYSGDLSPEEHDELGIYHYDLSQGEAPHYNPAEMRAHEFASEYHAKRGTEQPPEEYVAYHNRHSTLPYGEVDKNTAGWLSQHHADKFKEIGHFLRPEFLRNNSSRETELLKKHDLHKRAALHYGQIADPSSALSLHISKFSRKASA